MRIEGAHALITGGASGLGLAAAQRLVSRGATVFLVDLPDSDGPRVAARLGGDTQFIPTDVTDEAQVASAVALAGKDGPLRIVANCAGVATPGKLLGRDGPLSYDAYMRVVAINLGGTVNVTAQAAAAIAGTEPIDGERGVIINTASAAGLEGQIGQIAYGSSKAGVIGLTLPAARELARHQIRVMTIAPGVFQTPMMAGLPPQVQEALGGKTPHPNRLGQPEEYAALVDHIVTNPMLNGETIRLDGAIRLEPR